MKFLLLVIGLFAGYYVAKVVHHGWRLYRDRDRRDAIDLNRPGRLANLLEIERRQQGDAGK